MLYRQNWTVEAGKVLKRFEKNVIHKAKTEGYDGGDDNDGNAQWGFSGALLYSVTVITTIGERAKSRVFEVKRRWYLFRIAHEAI